MSTPIGNIIINPPPTTLVATALPNSIALRVPYDNVPPSVSNTQLDNNARSNQNILQKSGDAQAAAAITSSTENFSVTSIANTQALNIAAQTTFLAQLAAGDISPEVRTIFAQYDKLVSYANVKYKPSNAGKPSEPVGMFGRLLQQEKTPVELPQTVQENIQNTEQDNIEELPQTIPINNSTQQTVIANDNQIPEIRFLRLNAYSKTIARNNNETTSDIEKA